MSFDDDLLADAMDLLDDEEEVQVITEKDGEEKFFGLIADDPHPLFPLCTTWTVVEVTYDAETA